MERIELPSYDHIDALFCAFLLKGHRLTYQSWLDLTGRQHANQRAWGLWDMGLPVKAPKYAVTWARNNIAVYQLDKAFIDELGERGQRFIERVQKHYANDPQITKGLQSKPQPLQSILAGKPSNLQIINEQASKSSHQVLGKLDMERD